MEASFKSKLKSSESMLVSCYVYISDVGASEGTYSSTLDLGEMIE